MNQPAPETLPTDAARRFRVRPIRPRKMNFPFGTEVPRLWFANSPLLTHLINGLNLLFPEGERFFIRSVKPYRKSIRDPELRRQVDGFIAQEVRHGIEHERFFATLEEQGLRIGPFMEFFVEHFKVLPDDAFEETFDEEVQLAVTVALEHFTAMMGDLALATDVLDDAHPAVRDLLMWHAAEEIEHKAVAFDVLQEVNPDYGLRMKGLLLATVGLFGWWYAATSMLLREERRLSTDERTAMKRARDAAVALRDAWEALVRRGLAFRLLRAFFSYMRPGFHPTDHDNLHLAEEWLAPIDA